MEAITMVKEQAPVSRLTLKVKFENTIYRIIDKKILFIARNIEDQHRDCKDPETMDKIGDTFLFLQKNSPEQIVKISGEDNVKKLVPLRELEFLPI
ncbi:MAG: hypothetical protein WC458_03045 [Patescibacteria group bacterium]|jgi:thymidylate kinase